VARALVRTASPLVAMPGLGRQFAMRTPRLLIDSDLCRATGPDGTFCSTYFKDGAAR